jgi:ribosomal protein S27AE
MAYDDPIAIALTNAANSVTARVEHRACPACDAEAWTFPTDRAFGIQWVVPADGGITLTQTVHLAIPFTCGNCGYIRLHIPPENVYQD